LTLINLLTLSAVLAPCLACAQQGQAAPRIYNTVKQKLAQGKQVVGGTIFAANSTTYCAMATAGFDFLWIEMQHSPMTYADAAGMMMACRGYPAIPFLRVPDATEGDILKALDAGALGIIVPTVDTVEKAEAAVKWAKYPPLGRRSTSGTTQAATIWGGDYRPTANDNIMVVVQIETPIGVANVEKIAAVPGVDVVFAASNDLGQFSGAQEGQPAYEAMVTRIHDATLKAGKILGGPQAWSKRPGFLFLQGPSEAMLIRSGAAAALGAAPAAGGPRGGPPQR
jgi:4-hydroxy-2-oxoheptanedioate aldolase